MAIGRTVEGGIEHRLHVLLQPLAPGCRECDRDVGVKAQQRADHGMVGMGLECAGHVDLYL
jgi:hypothetical protein